MTFCPERDGSTSAEIQDGAVETSTVSVAMVFAGGLGLAAYHAGVYEEFARRPGSRALSWVAGSSAGAITAALIAGNRDEGRIERLKTFWNLPALATPTGARSWRHLAGWVGAVHTRLVGSFGHFRPRLLSTNPYKFQSFYDLAPMKDRLLALIDFEQLNGGETRISVAATDIESGNPVIFDSRYDRIGIDHLMASCGFLPEFAPVEVGGILLGDGGLSLNAPFEPILDQADSNLLLYVVDLYARDGNRPDSLEAAFERKNDLLFGNQTFVRLKYCAELRRLRQKLKDPAGEDRTEKIILLSYRPGMEEAGPEKSFDFSSSAIAQRWQAGVLDMRHSPRVPSSDGIVVVRRAQSSTMDAIPGTAT